MNKWTPVRVEWIDSASQDAWENDPEKNTVIHCETVGYFLRQDDEQIVVTQNIADRDGDSESYSMTMAIPIVAVKKVTKLRAG